MTLCGTGGTLLYMAMKPLAEKYLSVHWRRVYLILNILMYLVPLPYFHAQYRRLFHKPPLDKIFPEFMMDQARTDVTARYIQIAEGRIYVPHLTLYILILVIFIAGAVWAGRQVHKYYRLKSFINDNSVDITDSKRFKIRRRISQNVRICFCGDMDTPFSLGVLRPVIVLPPLDWSPLELSLIIEHEATHIRQCDNLVKMMSLAVFALNFYNPLVHYLVRQWNEVAELSCDMKVIEGRTVEEARLYGNLIIDIARMQTGDSKLPIMGLSLHGNLMKKRIYGIKKGIKRTSAVRKLLGAGIMCASLFVSSLPVLAYMPKDIMRGNYIYDEIIFEAEAAGPYLLRGHNYIDGELVKYKKFSDGSCPVEYYKARICTWCLDIAIGELLIKS